MQPARRPITTRMVIAFVAFGATLSLLLAAFVMGAFVYTERQHVRGLMAGEMSYLRESSRPHAAELETMSLYQGPAGELRSRLPPDLSVLAPGFHHLHEPPRLVAVEEAGGVLRIVSMGLEPMHARERQLLLLMALAVVAAVYLSAWAGLWLSRRVVEPLRSLADRVAAREADDAGRLAEGEADDEVGALARALDAYEVRVRDLLERERQFTDQASHELRTPITVIAGASELLLADPALALAARSRIERIRRATEEMGELVETFLWLARDPGALTGSPGPRASLAEVVRKVVDSQSVWLEGKAVALRVAVEQDSPCPEPERLFAIVLANLVRNACQHTAHGTIEVRIVPGGVTVLDTGPGLDPGAREHPFARQHAAGDAPGPRHGLGLSLVATLCERQGWTVTLAGRDGGGTVATLRT